MGPARCLAPKVTCLRYPSSSPPSSINLYTLILWSDNLPSKYCPNNFPFAQLWYKSKWIVTAEIGSILINKEQKSEKIQRLYWLIDWTNYKMNRWSTDGQIHNFLLQKQGFQTLATTLQGPPLPPAEERQGNDYYWRFYLKFDQMDILYSPMFRGRVVTEKPLGGRRSRFARHSSPYWWQLNQIKFRS